MTNERTSLLRGYVRRMEEIARLTLEMRDIHTKYERKFGEGIQADALTETALGDRLATLVASLRADGPEQPSEFAQDVSEGMGDTALPGTTPAPGSALGPAEAPKALIDMASTEPVKWGRRG